MGSSRAADSGADSEAASAEAVFTEAASTEVVVVSMEEEAPVEAAEAVTAKFVNKEVVWLLRSHQLGCLALSNRAPEVLLQSPAQNNPRS